MKKIILLISLSILSILLAAFIKNGRFFPQKNTTNNDPNYNKANHRLYEWGKTENLQKPLPDILEFKMGDRTNIGEKDFTTFRIEKEFSRIAPKTWGYPIKLDIPLSVLDKQQTVDDFIKNYDVYNKETYQTLSITLNPAYHENIKRDKNNWETSIGSTWYALKYSIHKHKDICITKTENKYNYCDLYYNNGKISYKRYYWSNDSNNIDPVMQQPIIFRCNMDDKILQMIGHHLCDMRVPYNQNTNILTLGLKLNIDITSKGVQQNPFLYIEYMPKIIQFLREREVKNDKIYRKSN